MSKPVCIITASLLVTATTLQAVSLYVTIPALPLVALILTAAATLAYFLGGKKPTAQTRSVADLAHSESRNITANESPEDGRETGTVKWFNTTKGFGFIARDSGDDIFVHFRAIRGDGHRILIEGQRVEYSVISSDKGLQAEDVAEL